MTRNNMKIYPGKINQFLVNRILFEVIRKSQNKAPFNRFLEDLRLELQKFNLDYDIIGTVIEKTSDSTSLFTTRQGRSAVFSFNKSTWLRLYPAGQNQDYDLCVRIRTCKEIRKMKLERIFEKNNQRHLCPERTIIKH